MPRINRNHHVQFKNMHRYKLSFSRILNDKECLGHSSQGKYFEKKNILLSNIETELLFRYLKVFFLKTKIK